MLAIIAAAVACGIIGAGTGYFYRKKIAEGKIGQAEIEAQRILTTAQQNAEARKKELVLEGKEEVHKLRSDAERDNKERRNELQRMERRLLQKEEHLDKKSDSMEKKEEALQRKEDEVTQVQEKIEALHVQEMAELERISGLTFDEAKELLLANVKTEVKHDTAQLIKTLEEQAKEEAEGKAREIISTAILRCRSCSRNDGVCCFLAER